MSIRGAEHVARVVDIYNLDATLLGDPLLSGETVPLAMSETGKDLSVYSQQDAATLHRVLTGIVIGPCRELEKRIAATINPTAPIQEWSRQQTLSGEAILLASKEKGTSTSKLGCFTLQAVHPGELSVVTREAAFHVTRGGAALKDTWIAFALGATLRGTLHRVREKQVAFALGFSLHEHLEGGDGTLRLSSRFAPIDTPELVASTQLANHPYSTQGKPIKVHGENYRYRYE